MQNKEELQEYDIQRSHKPYPKGVSVMLRVKNEEGLIIPCLHSIIDLFDEIVIADNNSKDATPQLIDDFQQKFDPLQKIKRYDYPFKIAGYGPQHKSTPIDSVHSVPYFYNWTLSKCTRSHVCKWDADMILRKDYKEEFQELLQQCTKSNDVLWSIGGYTVYKALNGNYYCDEAYFTDEVRIFPNRICVRFTKGVDLEILRSGKEMETNLLYAPFFYEMKDASRNEFEHWSTLEFPTERKQREWQVWESLKNETKDRAGIKRINDPTTMWEPLDAKPKSTQSNYSFFKKILTTTQ